MFLGLIVRLGDNSRLVGIDVFVNIVGDIVAFNANVSLEVTKLVGELDCEMDTVELYSIVGIPVMLTSTNVGLGDGSKLVGTDVF